MKTLILGSEGLVGQALARQIPTAIKGTHENLDITRYDALFKVFADERPSVVYCAAANPNVDACEKIETNKVNISGTLLVLRLCEMFDAKLVWFSSSYVFDGKSRYPYSEQELTNPIQAYGKQKLSTETNILASGHNALIVRTVGVFGEERGNKNFVKSVASSVASNRKVFVPTDQYMNPVSSIDLASVTIHLAKNYNGIYHVAGDEVLSKYEFALRIAKFFDKEKMVEGVTSDKINQPALRPRMGALDCSQIGRLGEKIPSFEKGLSTFLEFEYG